MHKLFFTVLVSLLSAFELFSQHLEVPNGIIYLQPEEISDSSLITKNVLTIVSVSNVYAYKADQHFINIEKKNASNPIAISFNPLSFEDGGAFLKGLAGKRIIVWGKVRAFTDGRGKQRLGFDIGSEKQVGIVF